MITISISAGEKCNRVYEREPEGIKPTPDQVLDYLECIKQQLLVVEFMILPTKDGYLPIDLKACKPGFGDERLMAYVNRQNPFAGDLLEKLLFFGKDEKRFIIDRFYQGQEARFNYSLWQVFKVLNGKVEFDEESKTLKILKKRKKELTLEHQLQKQSEK